MYTYSPEARIDLPRIRIHLLLSSRAFFSCKRIRAEIGANIGYPHSIGTVRPRNINHFNTVFCSHHPLLPTIRSRCSFERQGVGSTKQRNLALIVGRKRSGRCANVVVPSPTDVKVGIHLHIRPVDRLTGVVAQTNNSMQSLTVPTLFTPRDTVNGKRCRAPGGGRWIRSGRWWIRSGRWLARLDAHTSSTADEVPATVLRHFHTAAYLGGFIDITARWRGDDGTRDKKEYSTCGNERRHDLLGKYEGSNERWNDEIMGTAWKPVP